MKMVGNKRLRFFVGNGKLQRNGAVTALFAVVGIMGSQLGFSQQPQAPAPAVPYPQIDLPGEEPSAAPTVPVAPATQQQQQAPAAPQTPSSIAVTMPVPKLPYNMPRTRSSQERYDTEMNRSLQNARLQREALKRASMQYEANQNPQTRQEILKWSHPENMLKVSTKTSEGSVNENSTPVGQLLGMKPEDVRPVANAALLPQNEQTVQFTPPAPVPPTASVAPIASAIPIPQMGVASNAPIPAPNQIISNAGGVPQPFAPPPAPTLPSGIEVAPTTVPATPQPVAAPEKRKGLFGRMFSKKDREKRKEDQGMMPPRIISTGPQTGAPPPVAPSPNAEVHAAAMNPTGDGQVKYVVVKIEAGTHFVIAGDTANGQSGILVPNGTVLQVIGRNGDWTTVKSPNGTIGSVQTVDIREANFDESIQFISSSSEPE